MHSTTSYIQHPNNYSTILSDTYHRHYLDYSINTNTSSINSNSTDLLSNINYNTNLDFISHSNNIKQLQSDDEENNQSISSSLDITINNSLISLKKRCRVIPDDEKDACYYQKRARNNESAKRSRDTHRIREQQIQQRVNFLEHENSRLFIENQTIRYQISQLHTLCTRIS